MPDYPICGYCGEEQDLTGLVGIHTNQCPACRNPMFKVRFAMLKEGVVFIDPGFGGKWCKYTSDKAVCVEDDSSYQTGEDFEFDPDDEVLPF